MNDADLHALAGAYAADALDEDERRGFERHLGQCPACAQEVAELRTTTARLAGAVAAPPPAQLRARVLAEVDQVRQVSPLRTVPRAAQSGARRAPLLAAAVIAAVVSLASGLVAWQQYDRANRIEDQADRIVAILTDPDRRTVEVPARTGGEGSVVLADGSAVVVTRGLRALPADSTYQLWVIAAGEPRSAGLLGRDGTTRKIVDGVPPDASIGVTVEPSGGSRRPTSEPVLLADMSGRT